MKYLFRKKPLRFLAAGLDACAFLIQAFAPRRREGKPSHVLVVRLDHIGDILPATALPQVLKEGYGARRVSFLTSLAGASLLENNPFVDEVVVYDAPWFSRGAKKADAWRQVCQRLRSIKPDLALLPRGDLRENFLAYSARIPERVGYGVTGGGAFLSRRLEYRFNVHESERTLDMLRALNIQADALRPQVYFSQEDDRRFTERLRQSGLAPGGYVGVQLEAGTSAKRWTDENIDSFLAAVSQKLPDVPMLFIGNDVRTADRIARASKGPAWRNLVGATSLREMLWLVGRSRLFIGHDSGPTHLAASQGIPTLFLYSGTNPWDEWKPLAENADALRYPVPCSPCHLTVCNVAGHPCMAGIKPSSVIDWLIEKVYVRR